MRPEPAPEPAPRRLRILHVIMSIGPTNGQYNEHCLPMARRRTIGICCFYPPAVTPPPEIALFPGDGTFRGFLRALAAATSYGWDVIHIHAPPAGLGLLVLFLARRRSMAGTVYTVQNSYRNYRLRSRLLLYPILAAFARVVLCSRAALDSMPWLLRRIVQRKVSVVPNAVDLERIDRVLATLPPRPADAPFTVVSVGRLIEIKDPETLLAAFARGATREARLVFVGDGPLRARLEREATRRGIADRVTFAGLVDRDEVYRIVAQGDVVVSTSRGEGMPVAVLEAMACARPVILSDIPPHREIVASEGVIPLVPPGHERGFAEEIRKIEEMSPLRRAGLGERCRRIVLRRYALPIMHHKLETIYESVRLSASMRAMSAVAPPPVRAPRPWARRGILAAALILGGLGAAGGFAYAARSEPMYRATTGIMVGYALRAPSVQDKDIKVTNELASTYAHLIRRQPVLQPVIETLRLRTSWQELRQRVRATVVPDTAIISVTVDARTPQEAERVAAEIANQVVRLSPTGSSRQRLGFIEGQIAALQAEIEGAQAEIDALRKALPGKPPQEAARIVDRIGELERQIVAWQNSYATLVELLDSLRASNQLDVLEPASVDPRPIVRQPLAYGLLGGGAGVLAVLAVAYALHYRGVRPLLGEPEELVLPEAAARAGWGARVGISGPAPAGSPGPGNGDVRPATPTWPVGGGNPGGGPPTP
jgi:glycosyltransferase involved in cell wall biosynthesis